MKRLFLVLGTSVMVLPWLPGAMAHAENIQWSATPSLVGPYVQEGSLTSPSSPYDQPSGTAQFQIIPSLQSPNAAVVISNNVTTINGTNSENIGIASTYAFDETGDTVTKTFGGADANYSVSIGLQDLASGASGSLTFRGQFGGSFNALLGQTALTNTFLDQTQSLSLGKNVYTVTIWDELPQVYPSPYDSYNGVTGVIAASIAVHPAVNSAPEPSTLFLACLAVPPLGLARWLRRRKTVANHA